MNRKKTIFIVLAVLAVLILYLFTGSSDENEATKFQGGLSKETILQKENSVFDSNSGFLDFSGHKEEESVAVYSSAEPEKTSRPKSYLESLSPEERAKLYEKMYEKYKPIAEKFPNNSLIPRKLTEEQAAKKKEDEDHYYRVQREILDRRDVPKDEMSFYLNTKLKRSDDMLEILKFGMENYQKTIVATQSPNPEYEKLLQERLESIAKSREEVLSAQKTLEP